jgi:branched-chain amino acid transport system substrate-binding protein
MKWKEVTMKRTLAVLLLLLSSIVLCGPPVQAQEPIRIGVPLALTGPLAVNGEDSRKGSFLYLEEIGFQAAGRKIEVIVEDTEGKPDVALTKTRKLVERDRVHALLGYVNSAAAYAVRDYIHNQGIPTVITVAGAKDLTLARKSPVIFRVANDNTQENLPLGHYTYTKLGLKRAIVMASDFAAGREMAEAFMKTYAAAGGQVVQQVYAPLGTPDFAPFISRIRPDQADVLYAWFAGADPARLISQLKEYGFNKPIVSQGAFAPIYSLQAIGETGLTIITSRQYTDALETPENRRFVAAFLQKYKVKPDAWAEQGYVGAKALTEAVKAVGGKIEDRAAFLAALRKVRFDGPAGPVWFDENQQRVFDLLIRKVEKVGNEYVNRVIDKIPNASQSWTP